MKKFVSFYVFPTRTRKPYNQESFNSLWQWTMKKVLKLGVIKEKSTFHNIRAMAPTKIEEERDLNSAADTAGYSTPRITKTIYLRGIKERNPTE